MTNRLVTVLVFLSGVIILIWQINGTIDTFLQNRTSFSIMQETAQSLVPPTIVFCSRNPKSGGSQDFLVNTSNTDQFNKEFFWINETINLSLVRFPNKSPIKGEIFIKKPLNIGKNIDDEGNLFVTVEELMNPLLGLCYAIIPDKGRKHL